MKENTLTFVLVVSFLFSFSIIITIWIMLMKVLILNNFERERANHGRVIDKLTLDHLLVQRNAFFKV